MSTDVIILAHNDAMRLNACLWSLVAGTALPRSVIIANTGDWVAHSVGAAVDALSDRCPVVVMKSPNTPHHYGKIHGAMFARAQDYVRGERVLFLQEDVVLESACLEELEAVARNTERTHAPCVVAHDIHLSEPERRRAPHMVTSRRQAHGVLRGIAITQGSALGLHFMAKHLPYLARMLPRYAAEEDTAMCVALEAITAGSPAVLHHTRPMHKNELLARADLSQTLLVPDVKGQP